jgi:uncharacterized protein
VTYDIPTEDPERFGCAVDGFMGPCLTVALVAAVLEGSAVRASSLHGPSHWIRVERNGLYLATSGGVDVKVVSLFALFHDARRKNDAGDPEHGKRGAALARRLCPSHVDLSREPLDVLCWACAHHTEEVLSDDPTVQACYDADRLDLPRVGIVPDPRFLNTDEAKRLAASGDFSPLHRFRVLGQ